MVGAPQFAWSVVIRTCVIASYVEAAVADGFDAVLNLGAGLDTRPYRLALPASFRWIEVDYPKLIAFKEERLSGETPTCALERVTLDLAVDDQRRQLLRDIGAQARKVLVLTEGVIPYLATEEVAALASDLRAHPAFRAWLVDYESPFLKKMMARRRDVKRRLERAPRRFMPPDWEGFFREQGWRVAQMRHLTPEGEQRGRPPPLPWWFRAFNALSFRRFDAEIRQMMGYGLLEPIPSA
jgi:methyltransferase (TIGR00027 family)